MSKHLSQDDIQNYLHRTTRPDELLTADAHLAECDQCYSMINARSASLAASYDILSGDFPNNAHLSYEQFSAYVDGEIGDVDREIVDVHKNACHDCSEQLDELYQLRATLQLETAPAKTPEAPAFWDRFATGSFLRFAAPAFAAILIGVVIWTAWLLIGKSPNEVVEVADPVANTPDVTANVQNDNIDLAANSQNNSNSSLSLPVISLADGDTRIEMDSAGNLTGITSPQFEGRIKAALTTQTVEISSAAKELRSRSGTLMGDEQPGAPFALTAPVGKIVQSDLPQFRWQPLKDAESYVVTIYDTNFNKIVGSPTLRQTAWTSAIRLKQGVVYQWQVVAVKDGQEIKSPVRPAPDARFKILDANAANEIAAAKRQGNSHLVLGILYAKAGLLDEAEHEFQGLLNQNPKSEIARKLLNKVRAAR